MAILRQRGAVAAALCGVVLVGIGVLFPTPSLPEPVERFVVPALPALWVAAALLLTPFRGSGNTLASAATLAYGFAFLLPAATARGPESQGVVWGFQAFVLGVGVVPVAWAANVAFIVALQLRRRGDLRRARGLAFAAALLAVTAPITLTPDLPVSIGFAVWAAAPAILALALPRVAAPNPVPSA
jgi:hypothetical protein